MSVVVWTMVGIALWHFTVLLPDKFAGGIMGAFLAALVGSLVTGYALPWPGIPTRTRPGFPRVSGRSRVRSPHSRCYLWGSRRPVE